MTESPVQQLLRSAPHSSSVPRRNLALLVGASCAVLLLTSCGADPYSKPEAGPDSTADASSSSPESGTPTKEPECPSVHGGVCLGALQAGRYTTKAFQPTLTYRVPKGWANLEDLGGNFLLLPPGADLDGVDGGTSDYIGVYTSIRPSGGCGSGTGSEARTPAEIAASLVEDPDLVVTEPKPVSVAGLSGLVLDIERSAEPSKACPSFKGKPAVPLIVGEAGSSLDHAVIEGLTIRLYLLASQGGSLAIEVDDVHRGRHLREFSALIENFKFGK